MKYCQLKETRFLHNKPAKEGMKCEAHKNNRAARSIGLHRTQVHACVTRRLYNRTYSTQKQRTPLIGAADPKQLYAKLH